MSATNHLLLRPPNWLGDVIMAQPAMRAIALGLAPAQVSVAGRAWLADLLPFLDIPGARYQPLPVEDVDTVVLFPNSFRSAWESWRGHIRRRIGFSGQWRRWLLTTAIEPRIRLNCEHHRDYYLDLAEQMGMAISEREVCLRVPVGEKQAGAGLIREQGLDPNRTICLAPGSQFGGAKRYPADGFAQLVARLTSLGWQALILGTAQEHVIGEMVVRGLSAPHWNAAGNTTLRQAVQILCASRLLVSNDSGLMHVAAGIGLPVLAIFGATDPARTSPSGPRVKVVFEPAECSPCLQRECTVDGQPCMANISTERLGDTCMELLA